MPTGRNEHPDRAFHRAFQPELDLCVAESGLADEYAVVVRAPRDVGRRFIRSSPGFVWDASEHPRVNELYAAADLLVSDFSSAMADYALTGRPILLLAPDHELYRDRVRGFTLDLEADGPGPILRTTQEVVDAVRQLDAVKKDFSQAYTRFRTNLSPMDDGKATGRAVDRILERMRRTS